MAGCIGGWKTQGVIARARSCAELCGNEIREYHRSWQFSRPTLQQRMHKNSIALILAAALVSACDYLPQAQATSPEWQYTRGEDRLRNNPSVIAELVSLEDQSEEDRFRQTILTVKKGVPEGDEVSIDTRSYQCYDSALVRVDQYPIQVLPCTEFGGFVPIPLQSELGQRIVASREVVVELQNLGRTVQLTFITEGLRLDGGA